MCVCGFSPGITLLCSLTSCDKFPIPLMCRVGGQDFNVVPTAILDSSDFAAKKAPISLRPCQKKKENHLPPQCEIKTKTKQNNTKMCGFVNPTESLCEQL